MSEGSKLKPPSLTDNDDSTANADTDHRSAPYQLQILTEFMAKEFLDLKPEKIAKLLEQFGVPTHPARIRELYDVVIASIESTSNAKLGRMKLDKMVNIFNAYSGTNPEKREYPTPDGVKTFEANGEFCDGRCRKYVKLTPAPAPAPQSPTNTTPFPPIVRPADARGIVSPTSPPEQEAGTIQWPMRPKPTTNDDGERVADASVCPPHIK